MKQIAEALALAQGQIDAAIKKSDNPAFKSNGKAIKYADLTAVWEACRDPLTKNGLSVVQTTDFDAGEVWLKTILLHKSGETIEGRYPLRPTTQNPQGFGSAITYARRYCLAAMVGIVADVDDDGNAASGKTVTTEAMPPQGPIGTDQDKKALANQWGAAAITQIEAHKSFDDLGAWHHKNADKIAAVRGHNEALHKRIITALDKRQNELRPMAAE